MKVFPRLYRACKSAGICARARVFRRAGGDKKEGGPPPTGNVGSGGPPFRFAYFSIFSSRTLSVFTLMNFEKVSPAG